MASLIPYRVDTRYRLSAIAAWSVLLSLSLAFWICSALPCEISIVPCGLRSTVLSPILIGLALFFVILFAYLDVYELALVSWKRRLERRGAKEIRELREQDRTRLLEVSRRGREQSMIGMGSLFIPTAFVLLGAAATLSGSISPTARIALAWSAPTLYVLWLFLVQLPTRLMDDIDSDMRLLAGDGAANVLHIFYQDRHGFGPMMWLRRNHWLAYLPLLTLGAALIIHSI